MAQPASSVETMLRYRLRFSTGRAFAIPTGQSKSPDGLANARPFLRTSIAGPTHDVNHRKLSRARTAPGTSEGVGPERRQRPSSDLRRSPAPAKDRPSRATRLLASESTPRGDILALQPVHRSRWTACRRGSAAPPTMVLEENVRVSGVSLPSLPGGKGVWRGGFEVALLFDFRQGERGFPLGRARGPAATEKKWESELSLWLLRNSVLS